MIAPNFRFVDLFAGVGGFHAVGVALDGSCVLASEIDPSAALVYSTNWRTIPSPDVRALAAQSDQVPDHEVLFAGFPCQPFSKSGKQEGEREDRGNLFYSIIEIVRAKKPALIMLENVRNLAGPKHHETLRRITELLEDSGYRLDHTPVIISPHELHPINGGRPQVRERVYILAVRADLLNELDLRFDRSDVLDQVSTWDKHSWDFEEHVAQKVEHPTHENLTYDESRALEMWEDFLTTIRSLGKVKISGFPIWSRYFTTHPLLEEQDFPAWKASFVRKNRALYLENKAALDAWKERWARDMTKLPPSKLKFEWQAQDLKSVWLGTIQFRPSGLRVKKASYLPALVAISQTSILGRQRRRISLAEVADLQGFPSSFSFGDQNDALGFKQMGNAVNIGTVYQVLRAFANVIGPHLKDAPEATFIRRIAESPVEFEPRTLPISGQADSSSAQ